ncbi:MAG: phosphotransferase [Alphaproteobacteria bacterium]|nr:phosphotransferase [Alphaproteobacteria bacterium]
MSIIYSMSMEIKEPHGRETCVAYFGDLYVMKRPLPGRNKDAWLKKQHRTKEIIDEIGALNNPVYNIPKMIYIKDDEYQLLEERASGEPLTPDLYQSLSQPQKTKIVNGLASFLVDMNELKPVREEIYHNISSELKMEKLRNIINNKMPKWFDVEEVKYMDDLTDDISGFEYVTREAWSHADLNSGNVLYDKEKSQLSFIDFAEADYKFIYRDIFSPLNVDLRICRPVYDLYTRLHDKDKYKMPGLRNPELQRIMRYRIMTVLLKRFIKAGDDLRINAQSEKTHQNNIDKVFFMRELISNLQYTEKQLMK